MIYNTEAEMALLGSFLLDPLTISLVEISPKDFYQNKHQIIAQILFQMHTAGEKIDFVTVIDRLVSLEQLETVGGRSYLAQLSNSVPTSTNAAQYAKIVKDKSIRRQLLGVQESIGQKVRDEASDVEQVLAEAQSGIMEIELLRPQDDSSVAIVRELIEVQQEYEKRLAQGEKYLGFPCGFEKIDQNVDGMQPGHLWVLGAWTSTGKTQATLNIVHHVLEQGKPVAIVSLEMSRTLTAARIIGIRHNISATEALKNQFSLNKNKVDEGRKFLVWAPLQIHTTYFDLEKIKMIIRRDVYTNKTKLVVVDYVQNILGEKGDREYEVMTQSATDFQNLARELSITILLVSQISNESHKGMGAGAGFKGTGALEAVADVAIRLERDKEKEQPNWEYVPLKVKLTKNRSGFSGTMDYVLWLKSGKIEQMLMPPGMYMQEKDKEMNV